MKLLRRYNAIIIVVQFVLGVLVIMAVLIKNDPNTYQMYDKITLFEKVIAPNTEDTSLYLFHSRARFFKNYFTLIDLDFSLAPDIPCPGLVAIDNECNYYISNANENLKVFDKEGNFIFKFDYPNQYYGTCSPFDAQEDIFLIMKKVNNNSIDTLVFKINAKNKTSEQLSRKQISELDRTLFPPSNRDEQITKKKRDQEEAGIYYEVQSNALKNKTIFQNKDGRFISPEQLLVYKIDQPFDFNRNIPEDKFIFDKLDISSISSDKVIYISTYKSDKYGNIFVSGVKSNELEHTKVNIDNVEKDAVKIYNLIFFIWEFQKNN